MAELEHLFGSNPEKNKLLIGKSLDPGTMSLDAKLFDFRIYRIPLTAEQIVTIHRNRGRGVPEGWRASGTSVAAAKTAAEGADPASL